MSKLKTKELRVCIVKDWKRRSRGFFWEEALKNLADRVSTKVMVCRLADRILKQEDSSKSQEYFLKDSDVIIINLDSCGQVSNSGPSN